MLRSLAPHEHCAHDIRRKNGVEGFSILFDQRLEHSEAGVINKDVEVSERLQNIGIGSRDVGFAGHIGLNGMYLQCLRGIREVRGFSSRDRDTGTAAG